jgi:two-component system response regulator PilR (NtrC family)
MIHRLLIIDDDPRSVEILKLRIKPLRFQVTIANDQETAYDILKRNVFDIALVDLRLKSDPGDLDPDIEVGYATIRYLEEHYPAMPVIAVTAFDEMSEVNTQAVKAGADDFWSKNPEGSGENLLTKIRNLVGSTKQKNTTLNPSIDITSQEKSSSNKDTMKEVRARIKKFSTTDATILLRGEPGTGKGFFAEEIHKQSLRKKKPFQVIHCPQQSKETFVSELFGHKKGSFTGAVADRNGLAVSAEGGTLFFDEIGDLNLDCQSVILRFIEDKEVRPLGSNKTATVDIRLITATNKNLEMMVAKGSFRQDLLDRLSGIVISVPPLKERSASEIANLAKFFYRKFKDEHKGKKKLKDIRVPNAVWQALAEYPHSWPGNVRELRQIVETTLMEVRGKNICLNDFVQRIKAREDFSSSSDNYSTFAKQELAISEREVRVLELIREKGQVRRKDVEVVLGCRTTVACGILKAMINKDLIAMEGSAKSVSYVLQKVRRKKEGKCHQL